MNNTISIIIPCKNRLQHLLKCLPTVLAQTWQDIQVIVVDFNCPELATWDLEEFDKRILHCPANVPESHWNLSEARNAGYQFAEGDRLLFLDADTILHPTFIEMEVKKLNENTFGSGLDHAPWNGCGCAFVTKEQFLKVRGYNEAMKGWGMEDMNFYHRLRKAGYDRFEFDPALISNIPHSDELRNEFHNGEDKYKTLEENNQKHLNGIFKSSIH
ncbi:MAG: glycosyltransferase family A protein [Bacteroidota bacterium]